MTTIWQTLRAILFYSGLVVLVLIMSLSVCLVGFLPFRYRQLCLTFGNKLIIHEKMLNFYEKKASTNEKKKRWHTQYIHSIACG